MEDYAGKESYCLKINNASKSWMIMLIKLESGALGNASQSWKIILVTKDSVLIQNKEYKEFITIREDYAGKERQCLMISNASQSTRAR